MVASRQLPTKINLLNRGIIDDDDIFCVAGCDHVESAQHLFSNYEIFDSVATSPSVAWLFKC